MTEQQTTAQTLPRRNAAVTDRARMLADYIDAHPELGEVRSIDVDLHECMVHLTGPRRFHAFLAWFYTLTAATVSAYSGNVDVRGVLNGVRLVVYGGKPSDLSDKESVQVNDTISVHTFRRWQIAGVG